MTPTRSATTPSITTETSIRTTSMPISGPVLGPRALVVDLFARALDGDLDAEDDLRELAMFDPVADTAHEALVIAELEHYERTAHEDVPPVPDGLLDRILAAIGDVHDLDAQRHRDATAAMRRSVVADMASRLADEFGELSPWCGCGQPATSSPCGGSSGAGRCRRGDH